MTQQEITEKLRAAFAEVEKTGNSFSEEHFFQKPATDKWSAGENIQHLFVSVKPLVGLFGKPELMLQQWGKANRASMSYETLVEAYLEKLRQGGVAPAAFAPEVLATQAEQMENLHSINSKFLERASQLTEEVLETCQIPHPLLGLLTVKEFLLFTIYHTGHHNETIKRLQKELAAGSQ